MLHNKLISSTIWSYCLFIPSKRKTNKLIIKPTDSKLSVYYPMGPVLEKD